MITDLEDYLDLFLANPILRSKHEVYAGLGIMYTYIH